MSCNGNCPGLQHSCAIACVTCPPKAVIWHRHCDPDDARSVTLFVRSVAIPLGRQLTPIQLGELIDSLAEIKRVMKLPSLMISNERKPRKCGEVECPHCDNPYTPHTWF